MAAPVKKTRKAQPVDDDGIPPFLRRKPGEVWHTGEVITSTAAAEVKKPEREWVVPGLVYLAETASEEAGFGLKRGALPRRWKDNQSIIDKLHAEMLERSVKEESKREPKEPKVKKFANMTRLKDIVDGMKDPKPTMKNAKKAIVAAGIAHTAWRIKNEDVFDKNVANVIRNYVPTRKSSTSNEFDKSAVMTFTGKKNPKKEGTSAYDRWALLIKFSGRKVGDFVVAGGNTTTLKNAIAQDRATLTGGEGGKSTQHEHQVQGQEGGDVRGRAKKADQVAKGKRDRREAAPGGNAKGSEASGRPGRNRKVRGTVGRARPAGRGPGQQRGDAGAGGKKAQRR